MTGRVYRSGTKSDVHIRAVYTYNPKYQKTMRQEMRILQALNRKDKVTKEMSTISSSYNKVSGLFSDEAIYEDGIVLKDQQNIQMYTLEQTLDHGNGILCI